MSEMTRTQTAWLDAIPTAIVLYQPDQIVFANRAAADLTGWSPSELIGQPLDALLDGTASLQQNMAFLKTRSGAIPVELTRAEVDYEGKPADLITLRRADLYRAAIERSVNSFYIMQIKRNSDGHLADLSIVDANELGLKQTGLKREQLIGRSVMEILPSIVPDNLTGFEQVLDSGQPYNNELLIEGLIVKNGWYHVQLIPLQGDRVATFLWDISARKEAEEVVKSLAGELEQQVRLMDEVLSATPDSFILFDRAGRYLYVNRSGLESAGLSLEQAMGKTWKEIGFPEETGVLFEERLRHVFTTGESITYEEQFPTRFGLHDFITTLTPIHDKDGSVIFMLNTIHNITERKRAEVEQQKLAAELEQQARLFDEVLSTTPDSIIMLDRDGHFLYANPPSLHNVNLPADKVIGKTWTELGFPEETGKPTDEMIRRAFETGEASVLEMPFPTVEGLRDFESIYSPLHDRDGKVTSVVITNRDITERKRMEEALRQNQQLLASIYESVLAGIAVVDGSGHYVQVNSTYAGIYGYTPAEMLGQHFTMILPPEARASAIDSHDQVMNNLGRRQVRHWQVVRKDGQTREVAAYNSLLMRENGEHLRVVVVMDVSEQRAAQRALEASEQRLTSILNSMEDAVWSVDADSHQLLYANPSIETVTGYTIADFNANPHLLIEIVHADDRDRFAGELQQALADARIDSEYRLTRRDGATRWIHNRFWRVENAQGRRIDGIMMDVTDRKSAADQAMQLALERERVRILSNFVRDASHEFRTPLSVINTRLYLLEKVSDPARQAEYIDGIKEQSERILKLVESLITMSRLDSLIDLHLEPLDLKRLLMAVGVEIESAARLKGLSFALNLPDEALYVQGEMNELMIAFDSIWDNALAYTPPGGWVELRCYRLNADEIAIEISDNGLGIAADEIPHIFERFYRADRAHSMRGFGLGLPIARKIIDMHGGRIEVESTLNQGSCFRLILRAANAVINDPHLLG
ncbi:MAG TPA: PAS domain S-box protein [Phototrophicaceae bacterium]|nr:PAS domain S-box protein [Phototrophicaceae bacterium]